MNRNMVVRMDWDDGTKPSVEVPALEFFAVGHGRIGDVNSLAVTVVRKNSLSCFRPMPTIEGRQDDTLVAYQIHFLETEVPVSAGYFHAQYRQGRTADQNPHTIVDGIKGHGRYVGTLAGGLPRRRRG